MFDQAVVEFDRVLESGEYVPALMNLGNIHFLRNEYQIAREFYERAFEVQPDKATIVLALARVNHELENYGTVRELYAALTELDVVLAEQFAYLDLRGEEGTRAGH